MELNNKVQPGIHQEMLRKLESFETKEREFIKFLS